MSKRKHPPKSKSKPTKYKPTKSPRIAQTAAVIRPIESRAAEAMTIGWMLSMMATIICLLVYVIVRVVMASTDAAEEFVVYADLLLFTAMVIGIVGLILAPVVYRLRVQKPPIGVTRFAVSVSLLPLLVLIVRTLLR